MKSILRLPLILWTCFSVLVYSSVLVSPVIFKYSGIISLGVPLIILVNFIFLFLSILFKWKSGFVALFLLIIAYPFMNVAISLEGPQESKGNTIKVLNYNVKWFTDARKDNYRAAIEWIKEENADILCFQEFYPRQNISSRIIQNSGYYVSIDPKSFHVAIYSKYPIINDGFVFANDDFNNVRFADLKIKEDTIRVYSVHLESMGINPEKIQNPEGIKTEYENVKNRFVSASNFRTKQIKELLIHISQCKHRTLIVGDFNDVPFSYNYFQFRNRFKNAFEEVGRGFGTSYNGKLPFLRIDNQFYSKGFRAISFTTLNNVYFSDHYPLVGIYEITP